MFFSNTKIATKIATTQRQRKRVWQKNWTSIYNIRYDGQISQQPLKRNWNTKICEKTQSIMKVAELAWLVGKRHAQYSRPKRTNGACCLKILWLPYSDHRLGSVARTYMSARTSESTGRSGMCSWLQSSAESSVKIEAAQVCRERSFGWCLRLVPAGKRGCGCESVLGSKQASM